PSDWCAWRSAARATTPSCRTCPTGSAPDCCTLQPAWTLRRTNSTSISPDVVTPSTFRWIGSSPKDFAVWSSVTWPSTSATAPLQATAPWPDFRDHPRPFAPWGQPAQPTPSRSWCHATAWSAPTAPWAATAVVRAPNARYWISKASKSDARPQPGLAARRHNRGREPRSMDGQSGSATRRTRCPRRRQELSGQGLDHLRLGVQRTALRAVGTQSLHPAVLSRRGGRVRRGSSPLCRMPPQRLQHLPADVASNPRRRNALRQGHGQPAASRTGCIASDAVACPARWGIRRHSRWTGRDRRRSPGGLRRRCLHLSTTGGEAGRGL